MAAVTLDPDRKRGGCAPRIGLVLGAGGVLGAAWMTGALPALQDRLPGAINDVDVIVGTSAGSVLAAALRCRSTIEEMVAYQRGEATGLLHDPSLLAAQDGPLPPLPHWGVGSPPLMLAGLLTPHRVPPWVGASAWLPRGRGRHATLRATVQAVMGVNLMDPRRREAVLETSLRTSAASLGAHSLGAASLGAQGPGQAQVALPVA